MPRNPFLDQVPVQEFPLVSYYLQDKLGTAGGGGSSISASYADTASYTPNAVVTASAANTTITFTKGDGSTFDVTVSQSGSVATASYALYAISASYASSSENATTATKIQSSSIIAYINPSSGTFNIRSGSTDLLYVSSSNGNVGISGSVTAPVGNITTLTSTTTNVTDLLSFDRMTSLKEFVTVLSGTGTGIVSYSSLDYFGIVIDGVALDTNTNDSLIFRYTVCNNQIKVGSPDTAILSSTDSTFAREFYDKVDFTAVIDIISNIVNVRVSNTYSNDLNIRPMYRLVKAAI
jgi:hypothetical protein